MSQPFAQGRPHASNEQVVTRATCILYRLVAGTIAIQVGFAATESTHTVALFPAASDPARQGIARVINHTAHGGEIQVVAIDDAGQRTEPITLTVNGRQTVHFNSDDLEYGNEDEGLPRGVGPGQGDWRLELASDLDIEVLAYIRTSDGCLTAMHDTVPATSDRHHTTVFNPASNRDQVSHLRLVNPGEADATVTISGADAEGVSGDDTVEVSIGAGASATLTAVELESRGLGDGSGEWRLNVESDQKIIVVNLVESSTGHLTNLSTTTDSHRVPLIPKAGSTQGLGIVRILNRSGDAGDVTVSAFDDTGRAYDPITLAVGSRRTVSFSSLDLEQGTNGLSAGTGAGNGDWRMELASSLDIEVLAHVRTQDGFLTAIHDAAPGTEYRSRVPTFNPGSSVNPVSRLRLVNVGTAPADIRIQGIDDLGEWSSVVQISIPAHASRHLTAQQLEAGGEGFAGMLGDGTGKWQLIIRSDQPVVAMSLMEGSTGHSTNLSTVSSDRTERAFRHGESFAKSEADWFWSSEWTYGYLGSSYTTGYEFAKYVGFQDLLGKHDHHLPTGRGLTVLQAEINHTPDDLGDVKHLFRYKDADSHSRKVAEILTELLTYRLNYTRYQTLSPELDSFHTTDTADLRKFVGKEDRTDRYPSASVQGVPLAPAKLLNVSNTNGGSSAELLRQFDKFVEENDLVACTAHSSLLSGNSTTSGMAYNSIVAGSYNGNPFAFDGARVNDHGSPRYKPDIVTRARQGDATSYSAPTVCSTAAMLLERAKLDPRLSNAYQSTTIKSILMAGATRFDYKVSVEWSDVSPVKPLFKHGEWERASDTLPLSFKYGAGALNALAAYNILDAGEFDGDSDGTVGPRGWDFARDLAEGDAVTYRFELSEASMFSAVLIWHRYVDDAWTSYLPDYELAVYDGGGVRVAYSNSATSNVELVETSLQPGIYDMKVRMISSDASPDPLTYGLAWTTKSFCSPPEGLRVGGDADSWIIDWDSPADSQCHKYRLLVQSGDEESEEVEADLYLDVNTYTYEKPDDASKRYFRVYSYPNDGDVAYRYPSSPSRIIGSP